jgi:hypothetical protein
MGGIHHCKFLGVLRESCSKRPSDNASPVMTYDMSLIVSQMQYKVQNITRKSFHIIGCMSLYFKILLKTVARLSFPSGWFVSQVETSQVGSYYAIAGIAQRY